MDLQGIHSIVTGSNTITTWSMSLFAGSLAALLSTSYIKPIGKWSKLIYLLFVPGWVYLSLAIYWGDHITRREIMAILHPELIESIMNKMNNDYINQLDDFNMALIFFCAWLFAYLDWWILQDFIFKKK